jgi:hypothetical protein
LRVATGATARAPTTERRANMRPPAKAARLAAGNRAVIPNAFARVMRMSATWLVGFELENWRN